eukprot:4408776-Pleurochrysis_carterae.AAC.1
MIPTLTDANQCSMPPNPLHTPLPPGSVHAALGCPFRWLTPPNRSAHARSCRFLKRDTPASPPA